MTKVLFVGQKPETVDFKDPSLPPGLDANKIRAGIKTAMKLMEEKAWDADECMISPDEPGLEQLRKQLSDANYDCVVVGAGIRVPQNSLSLFESVLNTIHRAAPKAVIAFNTKPEDTAAAAGRALGIT